MADEVQGWIERVAQLQATLNDGHEIAAKVIGPAEVVEGNKDTDCMAVRLSWDLERAINDTVQLVEQLRRIREQF